MLACFASLVCMFLSFDAIRQYGTQAGLTKPQKRSLYFLAAVVPVWGWVLTRRLRKALH